ncbi:MAG: Methionine aminopeptidase [Frankiales bacterium]|nr:Methionine aminopeptidase [Frankiales bacterium]
MSGKALKRRAVPTSRRLRPGVLSPPRPVPDTIARPPYILAGGQPTPGDPSPKSPEVLDRMRRAARIAAEVLAIAGRAVRPGVTTDELDALVHDECVRRGVYPSPLGYRGYPKSVCTSLNEVICHGIPDNTVIRDGDIVNLDVTVFTGGVHGDTNATFLCGNVDAQSRRLVRVTRECLDRGIEAVRPGVQLRAIGRAIQQHAEAAGFGVVRDFVGHGIGETFHAPPQVPHYDDPRATTVLVPGMTFTIEPMITIGEWRHTMWPDGWTAVTVDGKRTAQFEHTLVVTEDGAEILTLAP